MSERTTYLATLNELNGRENQEDSIAVLEHPPLTLLVIADGMGGHEHGEDASREGIRRFCLSVYEQTFLEAALHIREIATDVETLKTIVLEAIRNASYHVTRMVRVNGWDKAGSTLAVALIAGDSAVIANLGDSRVYHFRPPQGKLTQLTDDHSVAGLLLRAKMITPEMARFHEGRTRLEFHLGSKELPAEIPVRSIALEPGDLLLLSSDGVHGVLSDERIAEVLTMPNEELSSVGENLSRAAKELGETDNQSLILWRYIGRAVRDLPASEVTDECSENGVAQ